MSLQCDINKMQLVRAFNDVAEELNITGLDGELCSLPVPECEYHDDDDEDHHGDEDHHDDDAAHHDDEDHHDDEHISGNDEGHHDDGEDLPWSNGRLL